MGGAGAAGDDMWIRRKALLQDREMFEALLRGAAPAARPGCPGSVRTWLPWLGAGLWRASCLTQPQRSQQVACAPAFISSQETVRA